MGLPVVSPQPALLAALLLLPAAAFPQPLPSACQGLAGPTSGMGMGMGRAAGGAAVDQRFIAMMILHHEGASASVDVDRFFLERMIPHHRMRVMMASHAQAVTRHPQLLSLEAVLVRGQSEEIARMETLYRQWYRTAPVPVGR